MSSLRSSSPFQEEGGSLTILLTPAEPATDGDNRFGLIDCGDSSLNRSIAWVCTLQRACGAPRFLGAAGRLLCHCASLAFAISAMERPLKTDLSSTSSGKGGSDSAALINNHLLFSSYGESFLMGSEAARIGAARALAPVWAGAVTHH